MPVRSPTPTSRWYTYNTRTSRSPILVGSGIQGTRSAARFHHTLWPRRSTGTHKGPPGLPSSTVLVVCPGRSRTPYSYHTPLWTPVHLYPHTPVWYSPPPALPVRLSPSLPGVLLNPIPLERDPPTSGTLVARPDCCPGCIPLEGPLPPPPCPYRSVGVFLMVYRHRHLLMPGSTVLGDHAHCSGHR
jgi:hypothetical protein